jgi:type II secretion system protein H
MILRTANNQSRNRRRCQGLTLIELILVMALLVIAISVAAPSLSRFFHGRDLDSEARRFLALTRYGQSRAVSEGVPMVLWIDVQKRTYGLRADVTYTRNDNYNRNNNSAQTDSKAVQFTMDEKLQVEAERPATAVSPSSGLWWQNLSNGNVPTDIHDTTGRGGRQNSVLPQIRFLPDGSIDEFSPERVLIREAKDTGAFYVAQNQTRLNYEIQVANLQSLRR